MKTIAIPAELHGKLLALKKKTGKTMKNVTVDVLVAGLKAVR